MASKEAPKKYELIRDRQEIESAALPACHREQQQQRSPCQQTLTEKAVRHSDPSPIV